MKPIPAFSSLTDLDKLIEAYFATTKSADVAEPGKASAAKTTAPTFSGLALFLGFNNLQEFEHCAARGCFAPALKRARLRIEAEYEKKLHQQTASGAIFALRTMGWSEKPEDQSMANTTLKIKIIETGPQLAAAEKEVIMD